MVTIGTRFYPATADGERRQARARDALLRLSQVHAINLQFGDESFRPDGFETRAVLTRDSRTVTGGGRQRKPIVLDMFDALAAVAAARRDRYFAYLNADIEVTQPAIERILADGRDGYAFCRVDLAPVSREPVDTLLTGLDMFAATPEWWARERHRFRPYIVGEALWDNVYAAVFASHGRTAIIDAESGIFHEQHEASWGGGLYAAYNGYLAALDSPYFTRWVAYYGRLEKSRDARSPLDRHRAMRDVFSGPVLSGLGYPKHVVRSLRARLRYLMVRPTLVRQAT